MTQQTDMDSSKQTLASSLKSGEGEHIGLFMEHRPMMFGLAYRMLGDKAEAEDVLQEAYLRWHKQPLAEVESPRAWLATTVSRLSIDCLRAHKHRENYVGPWLPTPLYNDEVDQACPSHAQGMYESLSMAFLLLLEQLSPVERAIFLLREIFEFSFQEVAHIVRKAPDNCRQIARRAKARIEPETPVGDVNSPQNQKLLGAFLTCMAQGDINSFTELLTEDVIYLTDGGGKVQAALRPLHGITRLQQLFEALRKRVLGAIDYAAPIRVNGQQGFILSAAGEKSVFVIETREDKIQRIMVVRNPDKLPG